jgi:hypothetical protein
MLVKPFLSMICSLLAIQIPMAQNTGLSPTDNCTANSSGVVITNAQKVITKSISLNVRHATIV